MLVIVISDGLAMRYKLLFGGDEIISYLCATGNSGAYEEVLHQEFPYGEITNASEWTKYVTIHKPFCFRKIADDMCLNDIHPPLYVSILHLAVLYLGMAASTGVLLNMILQLLTLFVLYKLASTLLKDNTKGALAALLWAMSPAWIGVGFNARSYELVALLAMCYVYVFQLWVNKPKTSNILLLVVIGGMGFFTHFGFIFLLSACGAYCLWQYKRIGFRNILAFGLSAIISFGLMTLIHPCFADSFVNQQVRKEAFNFAQFPARITKIILSITQFFLPVYHFKTLLQKVSLVYQIIFTLSFFVVGFLLILKNKKRIAALFSSIKKQTDSIQFIVFMLATILVMMIVPYFLFITHYTSMGAQYLVFVYPFMAMLLAEILMQFSSKIKLVVVTIFFVGSGYVVGSFVKLNAGIYKQLVQQIQGEKLIVINDMDRRGFPRLFPYLKPNQQLLMDINATFKNEEMITGLLKKYHSFLLVQGKHVDFTNSEKYTIINKNRYPTFDGDDIVVCEISELSSASPLPEK